MKLILFAFLALAFVVLMAESKPQDGGEVPDTLTHTHIHPDGTAHTHTHNVESSLLGQASSEEQIHDTKK